MASFWVSHPSLPSEMLDRARASIPVERWDVLTQPAAEPLFPSRGHVGHCRICGAYGPMTEEHLPPKGSGNRWDFRTASFGQWIEADDLDVEGDGRLVQGGVRGHMLCAACNNYTGRCGRAYQEWADAYSSILGQLPMSLQEIFDTPGFADVGRVELRDIHPGRLARQALSMMLSLSGSADLGTREPTLRSLVLGGEAAPLPEGMRLFIALCAGPRARFAGGPWGMPIHDTSTGVWTWVLEAVLPPIGVQLILEGDAARGFGVDITEFSEVPVDETRSLGTDDLQLGFCFSPYPCDYRSAGEMRSVADREAD